MLRGLAHGSADAGELGRIVAETAEVHELSYALVLRRPAATVRAATRSRSSKSALPASARGSRRPRPLPASRARRPRPLRRHRPVDTVSFVGPPRQRPRRHGGARERERALPIVPLAPKTATFRRALPAEPGKVAAADSEWMRACTCDRARKQARPRVDSGGGRSKDLAVLFQRDRSARAADKKPAVDRVLADHAIARAAMRGGPGSSGGAPNARRARPFGVLVPEPGLRRALDLTPVACRKRRLPACEASTIGRGA